MSTSREGYIQVRVGHGLLIRELECHVMASTNFICPVDLTVVQSC